MKNKFLISCITVLLIGGVVAAADKAADFETFQKAFKSLTDSSGKPLNANVTDKEYIFVYYASNNSPDCKKFMPELIKFYKENKNTSSIEIIFVSMDKTEKEMLETSKLLPFPSVKYSEIEKSGILKYAGTNLPSLILADKNGNLISDCYEGKTYIGPQKVFEKMKEIMDNAGYD